VKRILVVLCSLAMLLTACHAISMEADVEQYAMLNKLLKDQAFSTAEIENKHIKLYNNEGQFLLEIPLSHGTKELDIKHIRKEGNIIYFVTYGSVDDEGGYMFINGDENKLLDGLWEIDRVTGNGYSFSTAKK